MKRFSLPIILASVFAWAAACSTPADDGPEGEPFSTVTFRLVDEAGNELTSDAKVFFAAVRPDCNMLVPFREMTVRTGSCRYDIAEETRMRVSVMMQGYNPACRDLVIENRTQDIDIVLTPRSGVTILSYNIKDGFDQTVDPEAAPGKKSAFADWVRQYDPDIVMFQEMNAFTDESLELFATTFGHRHSVLLKDWGYPTAITSKKEITDIEKIQITDDDENPPYRVHGYILAKSYGVNLVALHLSSQSAELRDREPKAIVAHLNTLPDHSKVVVAGDFNTFCRTNEDLLGKEVWLGNIKKYSSNYPPAYGPTDTFLDAGFTDVMTTGGSYYRPTFPVTQNYRISDYLGVRIDYVFVTETLSAACDYAEVIHDSYTRTASDHFPVLIHLAD